MDNDDILTRGMGFMVSIPVQRDEKRILSVPETDIQDLMIEIEQW